jgi:hypothetical protein
MKTSLVAFPGSVAVCTVILILLSAARYDVEVKTATSLSSRTTSTNMKMKIDNDDSGLQEQQRQQHKKLFNPWNDITFSDPMIQHTPSSTTPFSSFQCMGPRGERTEEGLTVNSTLLADFLRRTCFFRNLYYRVQDQTFHYFVGPTERAARAEARAANNGTGVGADRFDLSMEVSIGMVYDTGAKMFPPWKPQVHEFDAPKTFSIAGPQNLHFLLYHPSYSSNFGHFVWEDLFSLFSMLAYFGLDQDDQILPIFFVEVRPIRRRSTSGAGGKDPMYRCSPRNFQRWSKCVKIYRKKIPEIFHVAADCSGDIVRTGNWLKGPTPIGVWANHPQLNCTREGINPVRQNMPPEKADYILLPNVLAGSGQASLYSQSNHHRATQYWQFRNFMIRNIIGSERQQQQERAAPVGYITFQIAQDSSRPDLESNFTSEIERCQELYGEEVVKVFRMGSLTMEEQVDSIANSVVLFSNHGGGSASSIFLPRGSSLFLYSHGPLVMDSIFYDTISYFRTQYISAADRPHLNRTMALVDYEMMKSLEFSKKKA